MSVYNPSPTSAPSSAIPTTVPTDARRRAGYRFAFRGPLLLRRAGERETFVLLIVSFLDMMTTLFWVVSGHATEANPLLQWTFDHHPVAFVAVKLFATLPAIYFAPKLAEKHPAFTTWLLRMVITAYLLLYFLNI